MTRGGDHSQNASGPSSSASSDNESQQPTEPDSLHEPELLSVISRRKKRLGASRRCLSIQSLNSSFHSSSTLSQSSNRLTEDQLRQARLLPCINSQVRMLANPIMLFPARCEKRPVPISLVDVVECARFWAQLNLRSNTTALAHIQAVLNQAAVPGGDKYAKHVLDKRDIYVDALCVAHYATSEDLKKNRKGALYRARVLHVNEQKLQAEVLFVDYGNREVKSFEQLYAINERLKQYPFQAVQCKLAGLKPALLFNPYGVWTNKSGQFFCNLVTDPSKYKSLSIKVIDIDTDELAIVDLLGKWFVFCFCLFSNLYY